jgi:hypothetical protein
MALDGPCLVRPFSLHIAWQRSPTACSFQLPALGSACHVHLTGRPRGVGSSLGNSIRPPQVPPRERDTNIKAGIDLKPQGDLPPRGSMKRRLPVGRRLNVELIRKSVANLLFLDPLACEHSPSLTARRSAIARRHAPSHSRPPVRERGIRRRVVQDPD